MVKLEDQTMYAQLEPIYSNASELEEFRLTEVVDNR
jgi:hypothetical protein